MPVLGGIEATKIIRNELKLSVPIISLTANALKSDKEKYIEIGMNEYISKPFNPQELFNTISRLLNLYSAKSVESPEQEKPQPVVNLYDVAGLKELSAGDTSFFNNMILLFISQTEENVNNIREHFTDKNLKQVQSIVHKMRPSVNIMGVHTIKEDLQNIEDLADKAGSTAELARLIEKVLSVLSKVVRQLKSQYNVG